MAFVRTNHISLRTKNNGGAVCERPKMTIHKASQELKKLHIETPLIESPHLSAETGNKVILKMDSMQPGGSFKIRGHGHLVSVHASSGKRRFISSSGGNAGMAVALACSKLNVRATIVLPSSTPQFMRTRLSQTGAEVVVHGQVWNEADEHAHELQRNDPEAVYVSPFDDELLWHGHATLIEELPIKPKCIVVSVGGGGLLLGIVQGLRNAGWNDVEIIAAETKGADSFAKTANAGKIVQLDDITSIAKSLGALAVSTHCLDLFKQGWNIRPVVVSDKEAVEACSVLAVHHRVLVEPACGAAVAAARKIGPVSDGAVIVVVCGGNMSSPALLAEWISKTNAKEAAM